jgi:hypothetical protein
VVALTTQQAVEREQQTKVLREEMEQTLTILALVAVALALLDKTRSQQMSAAMAEVALHQASPAPLLDDLVVAEVIQAALQLRQQQQAVEPVEEAAPLRLSQGLQILAAAAAVAAGQPICRVKAAPAL